MKDNISWLQLFPIQIIRTVLFIAFLIGIWIKRQSNGLCQFFTTQLRKNHWFQATCMFQTIQWMTNNSPPLRYDIYTSLNQFHDWHISFRANKHTHFGTNSGDLTFYMVEPWLWLCKNEIFSNYFVWWKIRVHTKLQLLIQMLHQEYLKIVIFYIKIIINTYQ